MEEIGLKIYRILENVYKKREYFKDLENIFKTYGKYLKDLENIYKNIEDYKYLEKYLKNNQ